MSGDGIAVTRAWARARRLYRSVNFQRAYVAGAQARLARRTIDSCPYKARHGGGWSAWRAAWIGGFRSVDVGDE